MSSTAPNRVKGSLAAAEDTVVVEMRDKASVAFALSGTFSLTALVEISVDNQTTWAAAELIDFGAFAVMASTTAAGTYGVAAPGGATHVRVRASAYTSGTATVQMSAGQAPLAIYVRDPKPNTWGAGRKVVAAAGTATQLSAMAVGHNQKLTVRALSANTGDAFLGTTQANAQTSTTRTSLPPGEAVSLNVDNASRVWVDVTTSGNGVDYHVG